MTTIQEKALTVKHPWAWAIMDGGKDVENRRRRTNFRGRLFIHAGKAMDFDAFTFPALEAAEERYISRGVSVFGEINQIDLSTCGMVLGSVEIVDCHWWRECAGRVHAGRMCSEWAMEDSFHWVLAKPQALGDPFEARGKLGLWNLDVPR